MADVQHGLLHLGFLESAERMADRTALEVGAEALSYRDLLKRAASVAATIQLNTPEGGSRMAAVFADRSVTMFSGILGSLLAGRAYVPLSLNMPVARTRWMLQHSDARALIVDEQGAAQLDQLLEGVEVSLLVVLPDSRDVSQPAGHWPQHTFIGASDLDGPSLWRPEPQSPDDLAYLLFTSGTTGVPKGVMVSHGNISHFVAAMVDRYRITAEDRFSQTFDITFDPSLFDMFVAWERGACVCCPSRKALINPDKFLREKQLTVWFSVPSVAMLMDRFGSLRERRFPSLRWSLFCGECLPVDVAARFAAAAPNSIVENLYGPTELTVICSVYRWLPDGSASDGRRFGTVPIGFPLPDMEARIVHPEDLSEVRPGEVGELMMAGPQVTRGYWKNREATDRAFVRCGDRDVVFYRTGDRVCRPVGDEPLTFIGRVDHQIKVYGHRVELGEVESTLLAAPGVEAAVALGWPTTAAGMGGVAAFVTGSDVDVSSILRIAQSRLQRHAVPHTIRVLSALPHNANGKIDRQALLKLLDA